MLTFAQSIVAYDKGRAIPDRLTRSRHRHYLEHAWRMLAVYRSGIGLTRRELHQSVQNILGNEPDCDRRRVAAFCKLLDDRSAFEKDRRGAAAELRLRVFSLAAPCHPLIAGGPERQVRAMISDKLQRPWPKIAAGLYADVIDFQPLKAFHGYPDPEALLSRYNVAQLQACLYRAQALRVDVSADFKTVLRYAKLARLLHEIRWMGQGRYRIDLTGPASLLSVTRRYGVNFARFVTALLAGKQWEMSAQVFTPWGTKARLNICDRDGLRTHLPAPDEFDSSVEEAFAASFGPEREGWALIREGAILHDGQATFVPDFVLRHRDGREVLMEIVGFWTPQYLESKRRTIRRFRGQHILLAVAERNLRQPRAIPVGVIPFKNRVDPDAVIRAISSHGCGA